MENRKVFEFTYAEYPANEPIWGLLMVLISFVPHLIPIVVFTRYVTLKCHHHMYFFVGLVASHECAKILKKLIKQPRPIGAPLSTYGMPSDHSQFVAFTAIYLFQVLIARQGMRKSALFLSCISMIFICIGVLYSRVYLRAHTVEQVLVGAGLGLITGRLWYWLTRTILLKWTKFTGFTDRVYDFCFDLFLGSPQNSKSKKR
jgi:dolichyldiphosphatase